MFALCLKATERNTADATLAVLIWGEAEAAAAGFAVLLTRADALQFAEDLRRTAEGCPDCGRPTGDPECLRTPATKGEITMDRDNAWPTGFALAQSQYDHAEPADEWDCICWEPGCELCYPDDEPDPDDVRDRRIDREMRECDR